MERDSKLEDLKNKNHLLLEEKLDLKKQLERTEKRVTESRTGTRPRPNESFGASAAGVTGAS